MKRSRQLVETVIEDGTELVSNVKLAADHLQVQHRRRLEERQKNLKELLVKEEAETKEIVGNIADNWPKQCKQYENDQMKKYVMMMRIIFICLYYTIDLTGLLRIYIRKYWIKSQPAMTC